MKYILMINNALAIEKMPERRKDWERKLVDDFIKAIHRKQYAFASEEEVIKWLELFAGLRIPDANDPENFIRLESDVYGERLIPIQAYGFAQGYINFKERLEPLEQGKAMVLIPFADFYDIRQNSSRFKGCCIEIMKGENK